MSEESVPALERSRSIRGGHRGVVTKLVREAEEITRTAEPLNSTKKVRLNVIKQQLDVKLSLLNDMDKDILSRCELDAIAKNPKLSLLHVNRRLMNLCQL